MAYIDNLGVEFSDDKKTLISCPRTLNGEYSIPHGITKIFDYAFQYCNNLTHINIPNTIVTIGKQAFYDCCNLIKLTIPSKVRQIGIGAFNYCDNLKTIQVAKDNLNYCSLDGVLFSKNKKTLIAFPGGKYGAYRIPNTVITIAQTAFKGCINLTDISIPNTTQYIDEDAFYGCDNLTKLLIPSSIKYIKNSAFGECDHIEKLIINSDYITNTDSTIYNEGFITIMDGCLDSITELIIGDNISTIGNEAFSSFSSIKTITIPNSVKTIGYNVFSECTSLLSIDVEEHNINYISIDGVLFTKDKKKLIAFPAGRQGTYTIPKEVTTIEKFAFSGSNLTNITFLNKSIIINDEAFEYCHFLKKIFIPMNSKPHFITMKLKPKLLIEKNFS